ncbi:MAG: succinate dehydrogenase/fumarate reductase iron-sulfur subunit [Armatimonadetes bacterium]|nr:succinate dehydrogenase/fumarate reductase iron-sulfur subunit [Armatimonadota bacterium]
MNFVLMVWRQRNAKSKGRFVPHLVTDISADTSFMEMLDVVNEGLILEGEEPIAFDNDCREGICGTCCMVINGRAHGSQHGTTVCQLHMRAFRENDVITIEPIRAKAFPVVKDLVVDRSAFDKVIAAGGYISVDTGSAPDANAVPIPKDDADLAMDAAACIGCGACVATCKNASPMLFLSAKLAHLSLLPQGKAEWRTRVLNMVREMDKLGFGACTNERECEIQCPKEVKVHNIGRMNRQFLLASLLERIR